MKLIEIVMLMGAHCISPVEQSQLMTEAGKVECAAVVEKDTVSGAVKVVPEGASGDPKVAAVINRFNSVAAEGAKIVPAFAPAGSPPSTVVPPRPVAAAPSPIIPEPAEAAPAETPQQVASAAPAAVQAEPPKRPEPVARITVPAPKKQQKPASAAKPASPKKQVAAAQEAAPDPKSNAQCKGNAVAKWYKTDDGHRKYRCVRPEPTGDSQSVGLY